MIWPRLACALGVLLGALLVADQAWHLHLPHAALRWWPWAFAQIHGHPEWIGPQCCGDGHCIPVECGKITEDWIAGHEIWDVLTATEAGEPAGRQRVPFRPEQVKRDNPTGQCWYCGSVIGGKVQIGGGSQYCLFPGTPTGEV